MTASAFRVTSWGRFAPAVGVWTASWFATSAGRQPPRQAGVVEQREADVVGDPARLEPEGAKDEPAQARGERQREERSSAEPVLTDHQAEAFPVREPLPLREGERVTEAVLDHRRLGDDCLRARAAQAPAQLDVLTRRKARVEPDGEQLLALEHGRHEAEPVLAPARAAVGCKRLPPVARTRNTLAPGLDGVEAARDELVAPVRDRARRPEAVRVDDPHEATGCGPRTQHARSRLASTAVRADRCALPPRD